MLLLLFHLKKPRTQYSHGLLAILDLRFLVLHRDDRVGGQVRDSDSRVSSVHRLTAWPRRAEGVDTEVLGVDLDVYLFRFRKHRHCDRRCVYATRCFRLWNSLNSMNSRFVLKLGVNPIALDEQYSFLDSADARFRRVEHLDAPALTLCVARVHAHYLGCEQRCFIAAGSRADFEDNVLLVVWIFG